MQAARPTPRRNAVSFVVLAATVTAFAAGRATGSPEAKPPRAGWERVATASEGLRAVTAALARLATAADTVAALQAVEAAPPAGRPALAAQAVEQVLKAAKGAGAWPLACSITTTGPRGAEELASSPPPSTAGKVEHWGDPHENLKFAVAAGELTLTLRAPFPARPEPAAPSKPR